MKDRIFAITIEVPASASKESLSWLQELWGRSFQEPSNSFSLLSQVSPASHIFPRRLAGVRQSQNLSRCLQLGRRHGCGGVSHAGGPIKTSAVQFEEAQRIMRITTSSYSNLMPLFSIRSLGQWTLRARTPRRPCGAPDFQFSGVILGHDRGMCN